MSYSMVWFKRDLRWEDHEALAQAAKPFRASAQVASLRWPAP
jgi:deoxyribodipyrimidine photolyase